MRSNRNLYYIFEITSSNFLDASGPNALKKSSTEEILSHSVSETDHLQRQKQQGKLQQKSNTKDHERSGQDNFSANVKAISANPSGVFDEIFKVRVQLYLKKFCIESIIHILTFSLIQFGYIKYSNNLI